MRITARLNLAVACGALAVVPDLDLIYPPSHRTFTHSLVASAIVGATIGVMLRRRNGAAPWVTAIVCALAYGSHLLLDWLGGDTKLPAGLQLLWPFSTAWFISPWGLLHPTVLSGFFTASAIVANSKALVREVVLLGPLVFSAFLVQQRRLAGRAGQRAAWRSRHLLREAPP